MLHADLKGYVFAWIYIKDAVWIGKMCPIWIKKKGFIK